MENKLINNPLILKLLEKYKDIWTLSHFSSLGHWDLETYMPNDGLEGRSLALSKIATMIQDLYLNPEFIELINKAESEDLNDYELGIIRLLKRSLKYYQKLPKEFIEEFVKTQSIATKKWKIAKDKKDFSIFLPYLEKLIELTKKKAELLGYENHPYDALLDLYEEGLTHKKVEDYFKLIKEPIIDLIKKIKSSNEYKDSHDLEKIPYDINKAKELNDKLLNYLHYNMDHLRIDVSAHPFTTTIGKNDTRITTRYKEKDFAETIGSTIHEYGHALYALQSHEDLNFTPLNGGDSMIIHESQSRFWENFITRNKLFLEKFYNDITNLSNDLKNYSVDDIYKYFNLVKPSLIRVEADEVTYHLHVLIRYEIEKEIFENKIEPKDLPKIWNQKYKDYLGIEPTNDSEGLMQDVHWSYGSFGYFPTYSMGTSYSAYVLHLLENDLGKINELIKTKEGITKIQTWLKEKIHQHGSTYLYDDLAKNKLGKEFHPKYLLDYLKNKYSKIYELDE
ncbi:carboxypeptidase M32 [Candidatus Pacearchaeota archaeon]|nr:carboxypeptidase M32 [Candidatus Pacearchaeota archaeon]